MKKYALLVLLALGTLSTYAQVSFGVKAGYSNTGISMDAEEGSAGFSRLSSWHAGVIADISLAESFSLQPQLLVSAKGAKQPGIDLGEGLPSLEETKLKLTYLELPINFVYKLQAGAGKLFFGLGPYLAYGISGKAGEQKVKFDGKKDEEIEEGSEDAEKLHLKALDLGGNALVGYELKNGLLFSVNYSLGLTSINPNEGASVKNNYFGVSVGYLLHTKKK